MSQNFPLSRACAMIEDITGSCPFDVFACEPHAEPCDRVCEDYTGRVNECWEAYFCMEIKIDEELLG